MSRDGLICDACHADAEENDKECWSCGHETFVYEPGNAKSPPLSLNNLLDTFREDTEDLWEQFMEGDNPDPEMYDDFLHSAYQKAKASLIDYIESLIPEKKEILFPKLRGMPKTALRVEGWNEAVNAVRANLNKTKESK